MASRTVFLSAILSVAAVIHVGATEYFVDANRLDTEAVIDGLSRATAFKTIQEAVSKEDATIVTVYPGRYTRGDAETVDSYEFPVCVHIDKPLTLRSAPGGRNSTFIIGRHASDNGGLGAGAVRCISVSAQGVVVEGFTICDGAAPAWDSGLQDGRFGGGVNAINNDFLCVIDCVISNCVATRGGAVGYGYYDRCLFTCNKTAGGNALGSVAQRGYFKNCIAYKNKGPCFGYPGGFLNCAFVENTGTVLSTHTSSSVVAYNCVFAGNNSIGGNYYNYSNCVFDVSQEAVNGKAMSACIYEQSASQFINPESDDWRVCRGTAAETAGDAAWFSKIVLNDRPFVDYSGTTVSAAAGTVCAGPCQTAVNPTAQVSISVTRGGGILVEGAVKGDNTLKVDDVITVTAVATNRLFTGWCINGVMMPSENMTYSYIVTGFEESPVSIEAVYSDAWYVDANNGSDTENDGCTPDTPKKTLAAILTVPGLTDGDVVHAAQGVYNAGTMTPPDEGTVHFRARVPEGVTLLADEGPEKTFIMGAAATADAANEHGLGSNAVRCVMLASRAKVSGFTLTGGRTHKDEQDETDDEIASAVLGVSETDSIAENCIITGNVAYSASCTACIVVNSRICDNHATFRRSVGFNLGLSGCIIDRNTGNYPLEYFFGVDNCTIGPDNSRPILYYRRNPNVAAPKVVNSLILASKAQSVMTDVAASNSVFVEGCGVNLNLLTGCIVTNTGALRIEADYTPVIGGNVAVDAGDFGLYDPDVCGGTDIYGRQRVANGSMDIGAVEAQWLGRYSDDLAGLGIAVTNASPAVVETADGLVAIRDGRLDLEWRNSCGQALKHVLPVKVAGSGVLTVWLNGEVLGTAMSADGEAIFEFRNALAVNALSFVYVPGEGDAGAAFIGPLKRPLGHVIVIR